MDLRDHIATAILPVILKIRWGEPMASGAGLKEIPIIAYALADATMKIREMKNDQPEQWATIVSGMLADLDE